MFGSEMEIRFVFVLEEPSNVSDKGGGGLFPVGG